MVKWKGLSRMKRDLKNHSRNSDKKLDDAISEIGIMLEREVTSNAVFTKGYTTGNLRRMINYSKTGFAKGTLSSPAHYSGFVEKGTRYMDAQPFFFISIYKNQLEVMNILEEKTR